MSEFKKYIVDRSHNPDVEKNFKLREWYNQLSPVLEKVRGKLASHENKIKSLEDMVQKLVDQFGEVSPGEAGRVYKELEEMAELMNELHELAEQLGKETTGGEKNETKAATTEEEKKELQDQLKNCVGEDISLSVFEYAKDVGFSLSLGELKLRVDQLKRLIKKFSFPVKVGIAGEQIESKIDQGKIQLNIEETGWERKFEDLAEKYCIRKRVEGFLPDSGKIKMCHDYAFKAKTDNEVAKIQARILKLAEIVATYSLGGEFFLQGSTFVPKQNDVRINLEDDDWQVKLWSFYNKDGKPLDKKDVVEKKLDNKEAERIPKLAIINKLVRENPKYTFLPAKLDSYLKEDLDAVESNSEKLKLLIDTEIQPGVKNTLVFVPAGASVFIHEKPGGTEINLPMNGGGLESSCIEAIDLVTKKARFNKLVRENPDYLFSLMFEGDCTTADLDVIETCSADFQELIKYPTIDPLITKKLVFVLEGEVRVDMSDESGWRITIPIRGGNVIDSCGEALKIMSGKTEEADESESTDESKNTSENKDTDARFSREELSFSNVFARAYKPSDEAEKRQFFDESLFGSLDIMVKAYSYFNEQKQPGKLGKLFGVGKKYESSRKQFINFWKVFGEKALATYTTRTNGQEDLERIRIHLHSLTGGKPQFAGLDACFEGFFVDEFKKNVKELNTGTPSPKSEEKKGLLKRAGEAAVSLGPLGTVDFANKTVGQMFGVKIVGDALLYTVGKGDIYANVQGGKEIEQIKAALKEFIEAQKVAWNAGPDVKHTEIYADTRIDLLKDKINSAEYLVPEMKEKLLKRIDEIIDQYRKETTVGRTERDAKINEAVEAYLVKKVSGMSIFKDAASLALVGTGAIALRGAIYGLGAIAERARKANAEKKQKKLEGATQKEANMHYLKDITYNAFMETASFGLWSKDKEVKLKDRWKKSKLEVGMSVMQNVGAIMRSVGIFGVAAGGYEGMHEMVGKITDNFTDKNWDQILASLGKNFVDNCERMIGFYSHPTASIGKIWDKFHGGGAPQTAETGFKAAGAATGHVVRFTADGTIAVEQSTVQAVVSTRGNTPNVEAHTVEASTPVAGGNNAVEAVSDQAVEPTAGNVVSVEADDSATGHNVEAPNVDNGGVDVESTVPVSTISESEASNVIHQPSGGGSAGVEAEAAVPEVAVDDRANDIPAGLSNKGSDYFATLLKTYPKLEISDLEEIYHASEVRGGGSDIHADILKGQVSTITHAGAQREMVTFEALLREGDTAGAAHFLQNELKIHGLAEQSLHLSKPRDFKSFAENYLKTVIHATRGGKPTKEVSAMVHGLYESLKAQVDTDLFNKGLVGGGHDLYAKGENAHYLGLDEKGQPIIEHGSAHRVHVPVHEAATEAKVNPEGKILSVSKPILGRGIGQPGGSDILTAKIGFEMPDGTTGAVVAVYDNSTHALIGYYTSPPGGDVNKAFSTDFSKLPPAFPHKMTFKGAGKAAAAALEALAHAPTGMGHGGGGGGSGGGVGGGERHIGGGGIGIRVPGTETVVPPTKSGGGTGRTEIPTPAKIATVGTGTESKSTEGATDAVVAKKGDSTEPKVKETKSISAKAVKISEATKAGEVVPTPEVNPVSVAAQNELNGRLNGVKVSGDKAAGLVEDIRQKLINFKPPVVPKTSSALLDQFYKTLSPEGQLVVQPVVGVGIVVNGSHGIKVEIQGKEYFVADEHNTYSKDDRGQLLMKIGDGKPVPAVIGFDKDIGIKVIPVESKSESPR